MDNLTSLVDLCDSLQKSLNQQERISGGLGLHKVKFFSGLKPANYFLPMMHIGSSKTISDKAVMAWFIEVFVDGVCVFRETHIPKEREDLEIVEGMLATRVLKNIFNYGVMAAKNNLLNTKQPT